MPGVVGLTVIDSFALEVPMVTVDLPGHGPEIDYLTHGVNGIMLPTGTTPKEYAQAVHDLLADDALHERLQDGCRQGAQTYTIEKMVERFATGVLAAIE
jgi:glycosyltransferase involved in cell wall biosynthesis